MVVVCIDRLSGTKRWLDVSCTVHPSRHWSRNDTTTPQTLLFSNYQSYV